MGAVFNGVATPPVRWAGGKRRLLPRLHRFLPSEYVTYFEPMLGSGALFFSLPPGPAVIADANEELINFYRVLKRHPSTLCRAIQRLKATKSTYYELRAERPRSRLGKAARFYYLIRLSWNGLYRVNSNGYFNVPYSGRKPRVLLYKHVALAASRRLKGARLLVGDFEKTSAMAKAGDFVYFDPPYPKGACTGNGFSRYHWKFFTVEEHRRLANHAAHLADRGVQVLITEAARKEILQFYSDVFCRRYVRTESLIAADHSSRGSVYEAILTSYDCGKT